MIYGTPLSVIVVIALITQITTVVFLEYFLPPPALRVQGWSHRVVATATGDHAAFLVIVAKALWRLQTSRARSLEVFGGDSSGYGWGIGALDVGGIGRPTRSAECGVVQDTGVDVDQSLADAVLDRREVGCSKLVEDEAVRCMLAADLDAEVLRGLLFVLKERHGG